MKNIKTYTLISTVVATIVSAGAIAATPTFSDMDGDGVISLEEIQTSRDAMKATALEQYDANGDGELSRAEKKVMKKDRRAARIAAYDADGDGELSRAERRTAKEAKRAAIDQQLDLDQDGVVSDAEAAGWEKMREERHARKHHKHGKNKNRGEATAEAVSV